MAVILSLYRTTLPGTTRFLLSSLDPWPVFCCIDTKFLVTDRTPDPIPLSWLVISCGFSHGLPACRSFEILTISSSAFLWYVVFCVSNHFNPRWGRKCRYPRHTLILQTVHIVHWLRTIECKRALFPFAICCHFCSPAFCRSTVSFCSNVARISYPDSVR